MKQELTIEVIKSVKRLPTLPIIFEQVLETIEDPRTTARSLQETIQNDQSITAKVLSMANSAYYGYTKQVSDLSRAIVILGFDMVKNIALSVSIFGMFPRKNPVFDVENFWLHSISSAYLGRLIAEATHYYDSEKAFISSLLHDIGIVVLSSHFEEDFAEAAKLINEEDVPFRVAEKKIFGFDHADVGTWLGEKWDFPQDLLNSIQFHHDPTEAPQRYAELCYITYLANILSQMEEIGKGGSQTPPDIDPKTYKVLKINEDDVEAIREKIRGMRPELELFIKAIS
jgi:putative nucleotidyltransferase with HDIG domain